MCYRPVDSVLQRWVCCRGRYWPGHKTVAPPRPGTAAPPSPGRHPGHHSHNYNLQHWLGSRLWPHSHLDSLFMFQVSMLIQLPARIMDYTKLCCPSPCLVPAIFWFSSYSISLQLEGLNHDSLFHNSLLQSFVAFLAFIEILCQKVNY